MRNQKGKRWAIFSESSMMNVSAVGSQISIIFQTSGLSSPLNCTFYSYFNFACVCALKEFLYSSYKLSLTIKINHLKYKEKKITSGHVVIKGIISAMCCDAMK